MINSDKNLHTNWQSKPKKKKCYFQCEWGKKKHENFFLLEKKEEKKHTVIAQFGPVFGLQN